ncbi:TM2 domain-containing protein [Halodurantibacterium flavum]|uniref:TM2 domain-containing protein n=1 Tax=Halodurantibacterium flavum TaxID=1382802 RepID=A0ABW4SBL6_9RHOB
MALTVQEQLLIEQRVTNNGKSMIVAYLLWIFTGWFGGHRFYLGKYLSAILLLILWGLGTLLTVIGVGFILLGIAGLWLLIDAFLIPAMVSTANDDLRARLIRDMQSGRF